ncbi:MAG: diol dehydratase small subunit [Actinomycetales bacterium]|nr:diol dehydratase small subunit [Actinomycetales bacterium]
MTIARSGRPVSEVTLDAVRAGEITPDDVRIHPDTLQHQARVAEQHGNPQLAANFRRAAELTQLPDERVMAIYEALRPGRSSIDDLEAIASELDRAAAPATAALVREAAQAYAARGLAT